MYNCVICLPIMNCGNYLKQVLANVIKITSIFNKCAIVFGYDHSTDNSLQIINDFKTNNTNTNIDVRILINNNKRYRYRTHNLEFIRNLMISHVYDNFSDYHFFIMMDSDDVCSAPININMLKNHVNNNSIWDSLSFNRKNYYDIWALQYDQFIHHCRSFSFNSWPVIHFMKDDITKKLNTCDKYFKVYSAFNGFAIYKMNKFKNIKYDGKTQYYFDNNKINSLVKYLNENVKTKRRHIFLKNIRENCEHIGFHINAIRKNNARIYITKDVLFN